MTTEPENITDEEAAAVMADCARDAALRSLIADALALIACRDPAAVSQLRHQARRSRTGAELGLYEPRPGMDWHAYFAERADLLEFACGAAGMPHKSADILPWRGSAKRSTATGPAQVLAFKR